MTAVVVRTVVVGFATLAPFLILLGALAWRMPAATPAPASTPPAGHDDTDIDGMVSHLRARLAAHPDSTADWVLLGRTLVSLQRWSDAREAFDEAIAHDPADPTLHVQLGEVLTLAAGGTVTPAASAEFNHAPDDPRSRYYAAMARAQAGDSQGAATLLTALLAEAPRDAPWRRLVSDALASLGKVTDEAKSP